MGLNELPSDILSCVLEHLTPTPSESTIFDFEEMQTDWSAILALAYVNRRLYTHAVPVLYRDIWLASSKALKSIDQSDRFARRLARTLLEDPSKLDFVQSVRLETWDQSDLTSEDWSPKCTSSVSSMIDSAFADYHQEHAKWTTACLETVSYYYILPLLLARLPRLRYLALNGFRPLFWQNIDLIARRLTSAAATKHRPLSELKTVLVGECNILREDNDDIYPQCVYTESLAVVARWQAVEVIHGCYIVDHDADEGNPLAPTVADLMNLEPGSAAFTTVRLKQHSRISAQHLRAFLSAAKALETLEYQIGIIWTGYPVTSAGIAEALAPHAKSLKNVAIWYDLHPGVFREEGVWIDTSISFSAFSNLETLTIPLQMFFGIDKYGYRPKLITSKPAITTHVVESLPSALRELTIAFEPGSRPESMNYVFMALINSKEQFFPSLRCLTASTPFFYGSPFKTLRLAHREAADRGIEVRVNEYSWDDSPEGIRLGVKITFPPQNWDNA